MNKLDLDMENFESRVTEGVVAARFAAANTTFTFDNVRTGIPASPGITYLMPRYIGPGRTLAQS